MKENLRLLCLMGALGFTVFNALFYLAAHTTTALNIGIIQGATPMFILLGALLRVSDRDQPPPDSGNPGDHGWGLSGGFIGGVATPIVSEISTGRSADDHCLFVSCGLYGCGPPDAESLSPVRIHGALPRRPL